MYTANYWKYEHISFLINIGFLQSLAKTMRYKYFNKYKRNSDTLRKMIDLLMMIMYSITHSYSSDLAELLYNDWQRQLAIEKQRLNSNQKLFHNWSTHITQHQNLIKSFVNSFSKYEMDYLLKQLNDASGLKCMKICDNAKCNKYQCKDKHKFQKLKLCKMCKIVRYCSKKCQKIDWSNHKRKCKELAKNLS